MKAPGHQLAFQLLVIIGLASQQAVGFRLSFGHRLFKSIQQPQLKPADTLIRPFECRNANNQSETGICMFSIDCMQNKGVPLSICKHNYFVGTCCKLPDYNNFVGIVYDLRATEAASQQLEARRGAGAPLATQKTPITTLAPWEVSSAPNSSASSTLAVASTAPLVELADHMPLTLERRSTAAAAEESFSPAATTQSASSGLPERLLLDEKYVISSAKLFAATPETSSTQPSESARNADGSATQVASFVHIAGQLTSSNETANAYELLVPAANKTSEDSALALSPGKLVSSAHSAPTRLGSAQLQHQNNVYVISEDDSQAGTELTKEAANSTPIVFSSNHQPSDAVAAAAVATRIALQSQSQSQFPSTDQEFALQSASDSPVSTLLFGPSPAPSSSTTPAESSSSSITTNTPTATPTSTIGPLSSQSTSATVDSSAELAGSQSTVSPFVDLVSSPQTTTPFTSSLSTALLPNVSSHPYGPTTLAPATSSQSPSSSSTPSSAQTLVSHEISSSEATATATPASTQEHAHSQGPLFYSTATALKGADSPAPSPLATYSSRPGGSGGPQAASKIVTGNSATNNLIPGLSGLQSAILAHIPFKLASGLSSGLSSYLQAAMKPTAGNQRPLISSNTAPALQYQQNVTSTQRPTMGAAVSQPTAPSGALQSAVRFPGGSSTQSPSSSTSLLSGSQQPEVAQPSQQPRDVLKEAQLVCGRPQVPPQASSDFGHRKRVARIVGGNQSTFGQWPWMVSLRQWRKGAFLHKCGAALLNENWAITAAHCVENVKAPDLLLRLGEFDVSNQNEPYPYIERRVQSVVSHPSFDPKTFEYDLALIRFMEPIRYERNILPVCVPMGNDSYVDRMATVIGWGRLFEDGPLPDVIQHVDVPIITNQECEKMYKNAGFVEEIPEMFICAGINKGGRDSCEGDSGGPLTMIDHDGRSYLVGIISWGIGCALPSQPGVYTRITAFSPWINQIIST